MTCDGFAGVLVQRLWTPPALSVIDAVRRVGLTLGERGAAEVRASDVGDGSAEGLEASVKDVGLEVEALGLGFEEVHVEGARGAGSSRRKSALVGDAEVVASEQAEVAAAIEEIAHVGLERLDAAFEDPPAPSFHHGNRRLSLPDHLRPHGIERGPCPRGRRFKVGGDEPSTHS